MAQAQPSPAEALRARGLRSTRARRLILEILGSRSDHPTAEQLTGAARARGEKVGVATIYQNLNRLAEAELIGRVKDPTGLMRYESNPAPHHHLVCARCGRVADAAFESLLPAMGQPVDPHTGQPLQGWSLQGVQLEMKGLCPACR